MIRPGAPLQWTDTPSGTIKQLMAEHSIDLAKLDWQPANEPLADSIMLELALRHGIPCSTGIAIAPEAFLPATRLMQLLKLKPVNSAKRPGGELMETLIPGWTEDRRRSDAAVNESTDRMVDEARRELEAVLAADVKPELVNHWRNLGGRLPPAQFPVATD
jgi:hypothetical protein